jgi:hypothetical protein
MASELRTRKLWAWEPPMPSNLAPRVMLRSQIVAAAGAVAGLLGALVLWGEYGTTVFFETIRAGFVACFG